MKTAMSKPEQAARQVAEPGEIWLLIDSLRFGGIETHVRELASGLVRFNQPVRVVFLRRYSEPQLLEQSLHELGISCSFVSEFACGEQQQGRNLLFDLYRAVRCYQPKVLHAHGYKASIYARLVKLLTGTHQISTYHAGETPRGKVWLYDWLDRYTSWLSNHAISVSQAIAAKLPPGSITLNNFISQTTQSSLTGEQIAFIGRLSHEKAPERFVALAKQFPRHRFHLYGDGPLYQEIKNSAPDNLTLHGHISDMQPHWPDIALVVIPSRFEGLPMVSLEAMGRGIPVLATRVGALDTLIESGISGWIADNEQDLVTGIEQWQQLSQQQRHTIGSRARHTINESYTDQAVIPQLLNLYQSR